MLYKVEQTDFLIIGSGLTGLFAAYKAAQFGNVTIVTKADYQTSSSWLAQGGIAAAVDEGDSTNSHFDDTITAGRGLCREDAVRILVEEGKAAVEELIEMGMPFDTKNSKLQFGLEGGHSRRRILHAGGSSTGQQLIKFMIENIPANVKIHWNAQAMELVSDGEKITGVRTVNFGSGETLTIFSANTIIATGGYSRIFSRSTNPASAVGEGIWLAMNAGAELRDMEFVQFHPTAFYSDTGNTFLISEAIRGEGAYLLDENRRRFMPRYHDLAELAPRDIVAKAIYLEIQKSKLNFVYLDLRHLNARIIKERFPNIYRFAGEFSVDITSDLVPVAPAAHYTMGGIKTDLHSRTNLKNLFAAGETASTGVHGANRLASNSLLECLVFAKRAVVSAVESGIDKANSKSEFYNSSRLSANSTRISPEYQSEIAVILMQNAGIVRTAEKLYSALSQFEKMRKQLKSVPSGVRRTLFAGRLSIAEAIVKSALARKESRGAHQRSDYPEPADEFRGNFIQVNNIQKFEKLENIEFEVS